MLKRALLTLIVVAGCTTDSAPTTTTGAEPTGPGRLVVVDDEGDIVVMEADGSSPVEVAAAGEDTGLAQPIWSPDGTHVSWAQITEEGFAYAFQDLADDQPTVVSLDRFPYYAYWSPAQDRVGILRDGTTGVVFEVISVPEGEVELVEEDAPFYFSWSPAGDRVVAHAGAARLLDLGLEGQDGDPGETDDGYLAPQWIPGGVLHVDGGELVLELEDGTTRVVAEVEGLTTFVANRQGTLLALQSITPGGGQSVALRQAAAATRPNAVQVIDLQSGEFTTVSDSTAIGFFWSPDGERLLVLAPNDRGDSLVASVWSEGGFSQYATYRPSPIQVRDLFPFFPQYAQSLSFWAADSSAFVLTGEIDGETGVWVQSLGDEAPERVSGGSWAAWSP